MSPGLVTSLEEKFHAFDRDNPEVWDLFVRFAADAIAAGHGVLSASLIVERIRWETTVVTYGDDWKLNNNHRAYYARKYNAAFPNAGAAFSTRCVKNDAFALEYSQ